MLCRTAAVTHVHYAALLSETIDENECFWTATLWVSAYRRPGASSVIAKPLSEQVQANVLWWIL